jgi:hypothetical protein
MSKNLEDFNFNFINNFNVEKIANHLNNFDSEWFIHTERQNQNDKTHQYTQAYYINLVVGKWKTGSYFLSQNVSKDQVLFDLTNPIIKFLEKYHNGKVGVVMYVKLIENKNILEHLDDGDYLNSVRRHHIPIKTNKNVLFYVNDEEKNMKLGDCWEINNNKLHKVVNGEDERIHLIIDIMPSSKIKDINQKVIKND